jgi:hypothetical protein
MPLIGTPASRCMTGENRKSAVKANAERMAAGIVFCLIIRFLFEVELLDLN